ncbi:MBL fold metallo-hydrolase [Actinomadura opuntiae]|uniref:MBL fold metallo-hydrolase n=1 Tax=Actinomadura sp. OS1-43 TaxID=604315 RepID=UPI00255A9662|nr:MBL fold metallo-hydrolase [Actinomadura sp. OS1-43]MDL4816588.1 MBL fold metallo-hydrolase [Actinomadura sp. OS1-43]
MRVTVVGSGDAFGSGGRFQTCIALAPEASAPPHVLVDCGATSLVALRQQQIDPNEIDTVLITHLHGDHFGGIPFLVLDGQFRRRTRDLTVVGPPGTEVRLAQAMEAMFPGSSTVQRRFTVRVREHDDRHTSELGPLHVTPFEVRHASGAPAYAIRVETTTGSVAYSGDTEWTEALLQAADGIDLFLCEGYSPAPIRWHLDLDTLDRHRDRFTCEHMVLTHLSPTALASDLTGWHVAHDGLQIDL